MRGDGYDVDGAEECSIVDVLEVIDDAGEELIDQVDRDPELSPDQKRHTRRHLREIRNEVEAAKIVLLGPGAMLDSDDDDDDEPRPIPATDGGKRVEDRNDFPTVVSGSPGVEVVHGPYPAWFEATAGGSR